VILSGRGVSLLTSPWHMLRHWTSLGCEIRARHSPNVVPGCPFPQGESRHQWRVSDVKYPPAATVSYPSAWRPDPPAMSNRLLDPNATQNPWKIFSSPQAVKESKDTLREVMVPAGQANSPALMWRTSMLLPAVH
jgi:hypothetical protein